MKRILKWTAIIGASLLAIIIIALLLIPLFVDVAKFKPLIEERVSKAVGRPFSVGDDVKLSLFPWAGLTFSDLRLGNTPEFAEKDFLVIKSLEVRFKLVPLVFKDIQVERFILNEPSIMLVKNNQGRANWEMATPKAAPQPGPATSEKTGAFELPVKALAVGDFAITKGTAVWIDHAKGLRKQATDIDFRLKDVTLDQPVKVFFSGRLDGRLLSLTGKVGPIGRQIGQAPIELDISLAALEELKMKLKGRVENLLANPQADLTMEVAEFSLRKIFAALGQAFPLATSDPKVLSRLAFAARIKADQTSLAVSDGKLKLDESALTVMLKIINFSKPDLAFDLTLDQIDADRYLPPKNSTRTNEGRMAAKSKTAGAKTAPPAAPAAKYVGTALAAVDGRLHAGKVTINQRAIENIRIIIKGKTGPIKFDLAARLQEGPLNVNGSIGPLGADAGRQVLPLDVAVNAVDQLKLRAGGNVLNPGAQTAVEMSVKIEEFSPRKLLAALGQPFPVDMPDPAAINRFALSANLKAASDRVSVSEGQVILDESKMKLNFHAKDFSKPDIAFDLAVDQINLDRYLPLQPQAKTDGKKKAESAGSSPQKATTESPAGGMESGYEPLRRLVLMGQLQAGKVTFNNLKIQNLRLKVSADKGVINLDPLNMNLYEGSVTGKSRISVQQKEPASGVDLSLNDVQIGPLLKDLASQDILEGVAQSRIDLALTGDSAERIRRTLSGQGAITINDGAVKGYDLASMARNVESAFGLGKKDTKAEARPRTDFTELQIPFTIASGIVDIAKASMKSPFIRLDASGKADLVKETIDFYVDPKAVATIKGQGDAKARSGILVPIIVSGTFAEPQLRPDIKRIITQQVDKGILESAPAKKIFEKEEVKKFEEPAKGLLKDLLKKP